MEIQRTRLSTPLPNPGTNSFHGDVFASCGMDKLDANHITLRQAVRTAAKSGSRMRRRAVLEDKIFRFSIRRAPGRWPGAETGQVTVTDGRTQRLGKNF